MASDDFEAFYLAHYGRLVGQLLTMLGDLAEAEDAVQEAFARASVRCRCGSGRRWCCTAWPGCRPNDGSPLELTAFRTGDGGATWQRSTVGQASVQQSEDGVGPMNLSFVDAAHGWLLSASLNGCGPACDSEGAVLATRSAGRSWTLALLGR